MKMKLSYPIGSWIIPILLLVSACKERPTVQNGDQKTSRLDTIPIFAQSRPGEPAFDFRMPVDTGLDFLEFARPETVKVDPDELVLGIYLDGQPFALPIKYLSGFEVANLFMEDENYLLTWCPLVGSARIYEGEIDGDQSGFDFGRGLHKDNLLIVDRKTQTVWNQLSCKAIQGGLKGRELAPLASIQSTWAFWLNRHPETGLLINRRTEGAVWQDEILEKQYYNTWIPGQPYPRNQDHQTDNLGLGLVLQESSFFFPLEELFDSPLPLRLTHGNRVFEIHADPDGLTAWVQRESGELAASTLVYDWAWLNFYPDAKVYPFSEGISK
jgi:hypothetical protein